ncbi:hypothetical protein STENM223S_07126 [Streptomyces tendae]
MVAALHEHGIDKVDTAAILGAGATASSALAALARVCTGEIVVHVRSEARADEMRQWAERLDVTVRIASWADAAKALHAPLVVSTTPAGVTDALADAVPERPAALFDVLYDPWPTVARGPLVRVRRGCGRRSRPAGAPGGAPGGTDDRPVPGPAGGHAACRRTGPGRPVGSLLGSAGGGT